MKLIYWPIIILVLCFLSCQFSDSERIDLSVQQQQLKEEIAGLKARMQELDYLKNHSQVVLPYTELKELASSFNGQAYKIKILLPRDYHQNATSYPVLYVTDAETNFGGVGYIVQRLMKDKLIPPMIVVGIAYGTDYDTFYELRSRDLTPFEDKDLRMGGKLYPTGGAPNFCEFLSKELFPLIEENYRIDSSSKALYGHSYGGLFGTYVLLHRPKLFTHYLILSPSLWYKEAIMLNEIDSMASDYPPIRVYMASGELEGRIAELQLEFADKLRDQSIAELSLKDEILDNETHRTIFGRAFTNGMRYLFDQ